jgi:hypothetical protein
MGDVSEHVKTTPAARDSEPHLVNETELDTRRASVGRPGSLAWHNA